MKNNNQGKVFGVHAAEPTTGRLVSELIDGFAAWVNRLHGRRGEQPMSSDDLNHPA